ncbi:MAG TPA: toprim domain-containing protein, partial [Ktedonobacteraceae bacterium]|nr:toprim domain-containing protein [Ktedonobacteraceae bacterium]
QIVIVEGYVDAIIAHQYGTKQTVACIGSSITEKHIQQIKKLTKQVTLALDPDAAGIAATEHGIAEALKGFDHTYVPVPLANGQQGQQKDRGNGKYKRNEARGMIRLEEQVDATINVLQLPAGEDPDEVIQRDYAAWFYAVSHPLPLVDYYFNAKTFDLDLKQPNDQAEAAKRLLPVLGMISDRVKRDAYIRKLASMVNVEERSLHEELQHVLRAQNQRAHNVTARFSDGQGARGFQKKAPQGGSSPLVAFNGEIVSREQAEKEKQAISTERTEKGYLLDSVKRDRLQWEDYLIGLLLLNPGLSPHVCGIIDSSDFAGTDTRELYHILNSDYQRGSSSSQKSFEQLVPSALLTSVERARKSIESKSPQDGAGLIKAAVQCAIRLKRTRLMQRNTELKYLLSEAEKSGDSASVRQFLQQMMLIHQQLRTIDSATHLQG